MVKYKQISYKEKLLLGGSKELVPYGKGLVPYGRSGERSNKGRSNKGSERSNKSKTKYKIFTKEEFEEYQKEIAKQRAKLREPRKEREPPREETEPREKESAGRKLAGRRKHIKVGKEAKEYIDKEVKPKIKKEKEKKLKGFVNRFEWAKMKRGAGGVKKSTKYVYDKDGRVIELKQTIKQARRPGERRAIKRRERAAGGILTAMGIIKGKQTYKGAGRPRGTFKHGVPIHVWKQQQRDNRIRYQEYQQQQYAKLKTRGFSPEQVQSIQQQQTLQELEQPTATRVERVQQRVQEIRQERPIQIIQRRGYQKMRVPTNMHNKLIQPGPSIADEQLNFRKWSAETAISPRTQRILDQIRTIQNKGKVDNIEQQRRLRERNMVGRAMNLMHAHENMINVDMDMTGVKGENILMAPNVFKEYPENNILRNNRGSFSLLNTREAGNNLKFF